MNYKEAIHYLEHEVGFTSRPGLERIQALMEQLGSPQEKIKCIHIAGTNGKGSASAMLSSILQTAGYKTAFYTSPHLHSYNERFVIDKEQISDEDFAYYVSKIKTICDDFKNKGKDVPTLFEIITAIAFDYFYAQNVDIAIIEVGLGGRFDATNVISAPLLSLIMSISIDHVDFLGNTVEEIASEKAGILKKNCPAVLYCQDKIVYNVINEIAEKAGAKLYVSSSNTIEVSEQSLTQTIFSVKNSLISYDKVHLSLLGNYQIKNAITVLEACEVLKMNGLRLEKQAILDGIARARWAGRFEIIRDLPLTVLDGAHNADGIFSVVNSIQTYFSNRTITLLLGVLEDKEYEKMLAALMPCVSKIVFTEPMNERKLDAARLQEIADTYGIHAQIETDIALAYKKALEITSDTDVLLCCGSLYMIGELRNTIIENDH